MSLKEKLLKTTTLVHTAQLDKSKVYDKGEMYPTPYPIVNAALSGDIEGGLTPGILMIAGPSKHFKTMFMFLLAAAYLAKHPEGVILFYDSEFGSNQAYLDMFGIKKEQIIHCPITDIEELKHDIMNQLEAIERKDEVIILIDSLGNLASKKEVDDAISGNEKADMTRAKALKSLGRMITPHLTLKDIPLIAINHTYKEIGLYPKDIVGGGTGFYYSANAIWIIGRQQNKEGTLIEGYNFIVNIEKSRFVKEKSKFPVEVYWEGGIHKYSGLFDLALELGIIVSTSKGWYALASDDTKKFQKSSVQYDEPFWVNVFQTTDFKQRIKERYSL